MSYYDVLDNMENFKLLKGHVPYSYYYEHNFESWEKKIKKITPILKDDSLIENQDFRNTKDITWMFMIKKPEAFGWNSLTVKLSDYELKVPYEIWITPTTEIKIIRKEILRKIITNIDTGLMLFKSLISIIIKNFINIEYYDDYREKKIYSKRIKEINLNTEYKINLENGPSVILIISDIYTVQLIFSKDFELENIQNVYLSDDEGDQNFIWSAQSIINWIIDNKPKDLLDIKFSCVYLIEIQENLSIENSPNIKFIPAGYNSPEHFILKYIDIEKIKSFNKYKVDISEENFIQTLNGLASKEISIENKFVMKIPDFLRKKNFEFTHLTIPFPNEWEERIIITNSEDYRVPYQLTNNENKFANDGGLLYYADIKNQYKINLPPVTELKNLNNNILNFRNSFNISDQGNLFKTNSEKISTSGNDYYNLFLNHYSDNWILTEYEYINKGPLNTIEILKKEGINFKNGLLIENFADIKRLTYNFMQIENLSDTQFKLEVSNQVKFKFNDVFQSGLTIWNKYDKFMDYNAINSFEEEYEFVKDLKEEFAEKSERYIFVGQNNGYTIFDNQLKAIKSYENDFSIFVSQKLSKESLIFSGGELGNWILTDQRGYLIRKGVISNRQMILTALIINDDQIFLGQGSGYWTMISGIGSEMTSGKLTNNYAISSLSLLDDGNIFIGQDFGYWMIINLLGEVINEGYTENANLKLNYIARINRILILENRNLFLAQDDGTWTIITQNGTELKNGVISNKQSILSLASFPDGNIFLGQSLGNWTIINQNILEINNGIIFPHYDIEDALLIEIDQEKVIFLGQKYGYWATIDENGKADKTGIVENEETINALILLDPK